jgi:hypothetical protein
LVVDFVVNCRQESARFYNAVDHEGARGDLWYNFSFGASLQSYRELAFTTLGDVARTVARDHSGCKKLAQWTIRCGR